MNKVIVKGRICNELDLSVSSSGKEYLNFTVAVDRKWNRDETDFFYCVAFGKTAVFITTYFEKGREILVEGEMQSEKWKDKDGNDRTGWKLVVANVEFCGSKNTQSATEDSYVSTEDTPW